MTTLPMVLPPVVGGVALLLAFGRRGLVGQWLDQWFGIRLPFTTAGAVLAATFVSMPFFVLSAEAGFRSADQRLEEAARTLGARPWTVFRRVTLPLVAPSLGAGAVLCWARALGEFGATITFAGLAPGRTETMPLAVYLALESDPESIWGNAARSTSRRPCSLCSASPCRSTCGAGSSRKPWTGNPRWPDDVPPGWTPGQSAIELGRPPSSSPPRRHRDWKAMVP